LKILVLAVGRLKESHWVAAEADYVLRIKRYTPVEIREVKDERQLVATLPPRARLVALDEGGDNLSSEELARKVIAAEEQHGGGAPLCFAVGGADGFSAALKARATRTLAFGRVTLPHRLARIILVEQLYRAYSILRGEPYHRA
jgi:23S rRNA (pseudouridine1915-N3)-methyltransferase